MGDTCCTSTDKDKDSLVTVQRKHRKVDSIIRAADGIHNVKTNLSQVKHEGHDDNGVVYETIDQMWEKELKGDKDKNWYQESVRYWNE